MKRQGMTKPVIGGTPLISSAILKAAPEIPVIAPATFYATMDSPKAKKFVSDVQPLLRKTSGLPKDIEPSMYDANIYEIVSMYVDAMKKAGITGKPSDLAADRVKIRDYMANLKGYDGFSGPIHFGADGDAGEELLHRAGPERHLGHQGDRSLSLPAAAAKLKVRCPRVRPNMTDARAWLRRPRRRSGSLDKRPSRCLCNNLSMV